MKKLSKILGLKTPFSLYDGKGNEVYYEDSNGDWAKREYDEQGNIIYYEDSDGYWVKWEYDNQGTEVYREDSNELIIDNRPKHTIIIDGKKIKLSEESYQELAKHFKE